MANAQVSPDASPAPASQAPAPEARGLFDGLEPAAQGTGITGVEDPADVQQEDAPTGQDASAAAAPADAATRGADVATSESGSDSDRPTSGAA